MKYCCLHFSVLHKADNDAHLNIRVIKLGESFRNDPFLLRLFKRNKYRFFLTTGYEIFDKNTFIRMINYCPSCGKNLYKFYNSDKYINEEQHHFL